MNSFLGISSTFNNEINLVDSLAPAPLAANPRPFAFVLTKRPTVNQWQLVGGNQNVGLTPALVARVASNGDVTVKASDGADWTTDRYNTGSYIIERNGSPISTDAIMVATAIVAGGMRVATYSGATIFIISSFNTVVDSEFNLTVYL